MLAMSLAVVSQLQQDDYGPESKVGTFTDALMDEAKSKGWIVVSMKNDWKHIFSFEP
jgi:hypothetical protein